MSSPRLGYQPKMNNHPSQQKLMEFDSHQGGGMTYNRKPFSNQANQQNYFTSSSSRNKVLKPKNVGLLKIKNLKGMVENIIMEKKKETFDTLQQMNVLRSYQGQIVDEIYSSKKPQTALNNYNSVKIQRSPLQKQKFYNDTSAKRFDRPKQVSSFLTDKYKSIDSQEHKIYKNDDKNNFSYQKTQDRLLQSYHLKPAKKPTHKRKQSSQLYIERGNPFQQQNRLLRQQNKRLKQELNKAKSYIKLLQKQIKQQNDHIEIIEGSMSQRNQSVIENLNHQISHLTMKLQETKSQRGQLKNSSQAIELKMQLKGFKQQNEYLRRNMMKLLNSKLIAVSTSNQQQLISQEQLQQLYKQINFYRNKYVAAQSNPNSNRNREEKTVYYRTNAPFEQTPQNETFDYDESGRKTKTETALYEMASLLEQPTDKDFFNGQKKEVRSYFQY